MPRVDGDHRRHGDSPIFEENPSKALRDQKRRVVDFIDRPRSGRCNTRGFELVSKSGVNVTDLSSYSL